DRVLCRRAGLDRRHASCHLGRHAASAPPPSPPIPPGIGVGAGIMQRRGFIVLLTATVIVVAATIVVLAAGDRAASPAPSGERALPGLAAKLGDLAWVGLSRGPTKIDFAAVNGSWAVVEKGNYPAAQAKMRQLLLGL